MSTSLFSVTIFFVVFRESLEASLIVAVLLGLVEQILHKDPAIVSDHTSTNSAPPDPEATPTNVSPRILRKLRLQVVLGAFVGLFFSLAIGAAFIAIWFTQAKNLWTKSEQLWEGIFELIASLMIFIMGITMLKMENSRAKWRIKLQNAFDDRKQERGAKTSKWVLFILPMITVLREGLEAAVFVGGVSLAEPATSIPIAAIVGLVCGVAGGIFMYQFASRTAFRLFLICMTNFILLIGAGLFSRAVWAFQENGFIKFIGASSDDNAGTGPGSYDVRGNVWHLDCCDAYNGSWSVFNAIFGWQNSATLGSVLSYVFYWLAVIVVLVYYKFREGRTKVLGWESANGRRRRQRHEAQEVGSKAGEDASEKDSRGNMAAN